MILDVHQEVFTRYLKNFLAESIIMEMIMKKNPLTIEPDKNISDAINLLNTKKINQLVVLNKNKKVMGALSIHTLLEKGFI